MRLQLATAQGKKQESDPCTFLSASTAVLFTYVSFSNLRVILVYYYCDLHVGRELVNLFKGIAETDPHLLRSWPPTTSEAVGRALLWLFQLSFFEERHGRRGEK